MYEDQRLQQATELINQYENEQPLILFLNAYFRANKKLGSRDRRQVKELVFDFYRLGSALPKEDIKTRIAVSHFLRNKKETNFSELFSDVIPVSAEQFSLSFDEKVLQLQKIFPSFSIEHIFPTGVELSQNVKQNQVARSILVSSITWIRSKRTHIKDVRKNLEENGIKYIISKKSKFAIGIEGKVDFSKLKTFKEAYFEIQDLSSQLAVDRMAIKENQKWWDVCCGSGGKALLVKDQGVDIHMTLSDNRRSILRNLEKRFKKASIKPDAIFEMDVTKAEEINGLTGIFDRIMIDAPCSGSGTWARNPEWISRFNIRDLENHNKNQKMLLQNALNKLNKGGELYYMTCSLFKCENEDVIDSIQSNSEFELCKPVIINCMAQRGDNLFLSVIRRI